MKLYLNKGESVTVTCNHTKDSHACTIANYSGKDLYLREFNNKAGENLTNTIIKAIDDECESVSTPNGKYLNRVQVMECLDALLDTKK